MAKWTAIPYSRHGERPKATRDAAWDGGGAVKAATVDQLKIMCTFEDKDNLGSKSGYKLPHHEPNGTVVLRGVQAAIAAMNGARTPIVDVDEAAFKIAYNHLKKHYGQFDEEAPEMKIIQDIVEGKVAVPSPAEGEWKQEYIMRVIEALGAEGVDRSSAAALAYKKWRLVYGKEGVPFIETLTFFEPCDMKATTIPAGASPEMIPEEWGWVEGYGATFGNVDLGMDRIHKGAFKKSVAERVPTGRVKLLGRHIEQGATYTDILGTVTEAKEDAAGLWYHAELNGSPQAFQTRQAINRGDVAYNSIDYQPLQYDFEAVTLQDGSKSVIRNLREVKWWAQTVTPWPMNEAAVILAAKSVVMEADALLYPVAGEPSGLPTDRERERMIRAIVSRLSAKAVELSSLLTPEEPNVRQATAHSVNLGIVEREMRLVSLLLEE